MIGARGLSLERFCNRSPNVPDICPYAQQGRPYGRPWVLRSIWAKAKRCYQLPDFAPVQPVEGLLHVRVTRPALLVILKTSLVGGDSTSSS